MLWSLQLCDDCLLKDDGNEIALTTPDSPPVFCLVFEKAKNESVALYAVPQQILSDLSSCDVEEATLFLIMTAARASPGASQYISSVFLHVASCLVICGTGLQCSTDMPHYCAEMANQYRVGQIDFVPGAETELGCR